MNKCTVLYPKGYFENSTITDYFDSYYDVEMTFLPQNVNATLILDHSDTEKVYH